MSTLLNASKSTRIQEGKWSAHTLFGANKNIRHLYSQSQGEQRLHKTDRAKVLASCGEEKVSHLANKQVLIFGASIKKQIDEVMFMKCLFQGAQK